MSYEHRSNRISMRSPQSAICHLRLRQGGEMELTLVDAGGVKFVEGTQTEAYLARARDIDRVIETCFSERARAALLYAANLPATFFDLSSGDAGAILQKLRNYRIRLAVVSPSGSTAFSSRFEEMLADERQGTHFGVFETRQDACDWLRQHGA